MDAEYHYPLRLTEGAESDIVTAFRWFASSEGQEIAEQWRRGLFEAITSLSSSPVRPLVREHEQFTAEVRFITYRRARNAAAYRVLYTIVENGVDPPFVRLLAVRHGAQNFLTLDEAPQIEEGQ